MPNRLTDRDTERRTKRNREKETDKDQRQTYRHSRGERAGKEDFTEMQMRSVNLIGQVSDLLQSTKMNRKSKNLILFAFSCAGMSTTFKMSRLYA